MFDALLMLRDGLVDLDENEAAVPAFSLVKNADGARCADIREMGPKGMSVVMNIPAEPTTYADTLTAIIQASDHLDRNWQTIADFPILYALMRKIKVKATTAFLATDIGQNIVESTSSDAGLLLAYDEALATIGGIGYCLYGMIDLNDLFDGKTETVTSAGDGIGTEQGEDAIVVPTVGVHVVRFATDKRYIRGKFTVTASGNFGKVSCLIGNESWPKVPTL